MDCDRLYRPAALYLGKCRARGLCPHNQPSQSDSSGAKTLCRSLSREPSLLRRRKKSGFGLASMLTLMRLSWMPSGSNGLALCAMPIRISSSVICGCGNSRKSVNPQKRKLTRRFPENAVGGHRQRHRGGYLAQCRVDWSPPLLRLSASPCASEARRAATRQAERGCVDGNVDGAEQACDYRCRRIDRCQHRERNPSHARAPQPMDQSADPSERQFKRRRHQQGREGAWKAVSLPAKGRPQRGL